MGYKFRHGREAAKGREGSFKGADCWRVWLLTIYKRKNFASSDLCWQHKEMLTTKEAGYEKTVVGSVKYDPYCICQSTAGIPAWAIVVSILVVLVVAVAIFL